MESLNLKLNYYPDDGCVSHEASSTKPDDVDENTWMLFLTLHEFLQPDSTTSIEQAVDRALDYYDDGIGENLSSPFNGMVIELSIQIPYNHGSSLRLAQFLKAVSGHEKLLVKSTYKDREPESIYQIHDQRLMENLADQYIDADGLAEDGNDLMDYVNGEAFLAHFHAVGGHCYKHSVVKNPMAMAFEERFTTQREHRVQEAFVMGAAQHINHSVEKVWGLVAKSDDPEIKQIHSRKCFRSRKKEAIDMKWPIKIEKWDTWKEGFHKVADDAAFSVTCRSVVGEAVDRMELQEKMWKKQI